MVSILMEAWGGREDSGDKIRDWNGCGGKERREEGNWVLWFLLVIPATWEAETGRIQVQGQHR